MINKEHLLALLEGVGLILSPCILPVLPIVLASSIDGGKRRPLGVIAGFVLSFTVFALLSRQLILLTGVETETLRKISLILLIMIGTVMLWPRLSEFALEKMQGMARLGDRLTTKIGGDGFLSGLGVGSLIGLIWTPCAGPLMAAAVVQIVKAKAGADTALTVALFATGAGLPMLAIALFGRNIMTHMSFFKKHAKALREVLGGIIIAAAILIWTGADVTLLASNTPVIMEETDKGLKQALISPYPAPEIAGIESWINSKPLTLKSLRGKVVLIDFWTYSCINCVRTLPYVTSWDKKYRDKGLVILGIHTPEFDFEKKIDNVKAAVEKHGIKYPVALDNAFSTWDAFNNRYWPAHYLIDQKGNVVYTHFGEGHYDVTEGNIRALLGIDGKAEPDVEKAGAAASTQSPETYLGYQRAKNFLGQLQRGKTADYKFPAFLPLNHWALSGEWASGPENITSVSKDAALRFNFLAGKVFLVMGSKDGKPITVDAFVNGEKQSTIDVKGETLFQVAMMNDVSNGLLELRPKRPGLMAYAFTFGK